MKTKERVPVARTESHSLHPFTLIFLVALGAFTVGLIPITYSSALSNTQTGTPMGLGQAGIWSVFGEKVSTSADAAQ